MPGVGMNRLRLGNHRCESFLKTDADGALAAKDYPVDGVS